MNEAPKQEDAAICASKPGLMEADKAAVKIQSWWRGQYTRCCHPMAREVRSEIRMRRMQEHIVFLSEKLGSVQKQYEEERLQRLVQEEAVKFLWKESMQQWKKSVEQQLASITHAVSQAQISSPGQCKAALPVACSTKNPSSADVSFPDSGIQSASDQQAAQEDSFLSSGTEDSLKTVRALSPVRSGFTGCSDGVDSADCSLLEQYLSSVQQREEEAEEAVSDRTEIPQPSSPISPDKTAQSNSPVQKAADVQKTEGTTPRPDAMRTFPPDTV
ncbi:hypothetical protein INR49_021888 [Caranx melampygus]|nr:hypothetical protein INR49_021888 [Caranx melampygus]